MADHRYIFWILAMTTGFLLVYGGRRLANVKPGQVEAEVKTAGPALAPAEGHPLAELRAVLPPSGSAVVEDDAPRGPWHGKTVLASYHPRPAGEWQGMRVDMATPALCDRSATCGLAHACHAGRCGPCFADADCSTGEVCVLDHCVLRENSACRTRVDCAGEGEVCALSGYSPDPRGNAHMRAYCLDTDGEARPLQSGTAEEDRAPDVPVPGEHPPTREQQLLEQLTTDSALEQE